MATAQSRPASQERALRHKQCIYLKSKGLNVNDTERRSVSDENRCRLASIAMQAPILKDLFPMSNAWKMAILMIDCYGTIPKKDEGSYLSAYGVHTFEEAAEGMMIDGGYRETMSKRVLDLAAKSALHALNWARQQ